VLLGSEPQRHRPGPTTTADAPRLGAEQHHPERTSAAERAHVVDVAARGDRTAVD